MLFRHISLEGFFWFIHRGQLIVRINGALQANVSFEVTHHFENGKDVLLQKLCGNEMEDGNLKSLREWACKPCTELMIYL